MAVLRNRKVAIQPLTQLPHLVVDIRHKAQQVRVVVLVAAVVMETMLAVQQHKELPAAQLVMEMLAAQVQM